jgi:hypothetical protein
VGFPLKLAERRPKAPEAALLGLLRGVPLLPGLDRSWPEVLALADAHGVAPLLDAVAPGLPDRARHDLRRLRASAQARRGWQHAALLRLAGALEGAGALQVRGAAYAEDLYTAPELRPIRELEMLIAPSRTFAALERLSRRGYRIEDRPEKGWLVLLLRDPRDARVLIRLRRGFAAPGGPLPRARGAGPQPEVDSILPVGALLLRASATRLHPDDALLVHAVALAEQSNRVPLIEVVDLAHLFGRCDPDVAMARARQLRLLPQLGAALLLLERCVASAGCFGGAIVDLARIPGVELPAEAQRAVDAFELSSEPAARPGALWQMARALGLAQEGGVE